MSGKFFEDLRIPAPDISLEVGSGSHAYQTAEVMKRLEPVMERERPDLVLVVGDVNSTLAAAVTAAKLQIPVAHVEAGLRSHDRTMPEEINRLLTDAISEYLFVTEESGRQNLLREGVSPSKIHFVGNVMIDSLEQFRPWWDGSAIHRRFGVDKGGYGVVTLHRPSNVDRAETLQGFLHALLDVARELPIIFPVHPRTLKGLKALDADLRVLQPGTEAAPLKGLGLAEPLGYVEFIALLAGARIVLTDSGGLQEETTALGVPCLTLRENTERPVTVTHGTNRLVGTSPARIVEVARQVLAEPRPRPSAPPLWDGRAAERIVAILADNQGHA
jgi:UDP-N-acetylglucosamine 2-epimerase (non-hydrolysing)